MEGAAEVNPLFAKLVASAQVQLLRVAPRVHPIKFEQLLNRKRNIRQPRRAIRGAY